MNYDLAPKRLEPGQRGHRHAGGPLGLGPRERHVAVTAALVAAAVIAAAAAGYGAYQASENASAQAKAGERSMKMQQEAEAAAGEARRRQVLYDAEKKRQMFASREAAAGVQVGEGSLLEDEMQFSRDAQYSAEMAAYPHAVAGDVAGYRARIFNAQGAYARQTEGTNIGIATGGSLATSYGSYARSRPSAVQPTMTENYEI